MFIQRFGSRGEVPSSRETSILVFVTLIRRLVVSHVASHYSKRLSWKFLLRRNKVSPITTLFCLQQLSFEFSVLLLKLWGHTYDKLRNLPIFVIYNLEQSSFHPSLAGLLLEVALGKRRFCDSNAQWSPPVNCVLHCVNRWSNLL